MGQSIAVQVKRNKKLRKVGVEDTDRFLATPCRNRCHDGLYVTTSSNTRGAVKAANLKSLRHSGVFHEFWDAQKLLDPLAPYSDQCASPTEAAWTLRDRMPFEWDKMGDHYGRGAWPVDPAESEHINWWSAEIEKIVSAINTGETSI